MANNPCVKDQGLYSQIPGSPVSIKTFVDAYHRLNGDLEVLRTGLSLEPWQLYATMAFYCANKELFDAEQERLMERRRQFWEKAAANEDAKKAWAEFSGALRGDETDEEANAALERMS
jgi:hypothetical protein